MHVTREKNDKTILGWSRKYSSFIFLNKLPSKVMKNLTPFEVWYGYISL